MTRTGNWDLLLRGGHVIDPAEGIDGTMDVAVADGRIAAVGPDLVGGAETVDVSGKLVLPGMIDILDRRSSSSSRRRPWNRPPWGAAKK